MEGPAVSSATSSQSNCHPEATASSSPKDLSEPRDSPAFFAGESIARLARFLRHRLRPETQKAQPVGYAFLFSTL